MARPLRVAIIGCGAVAGGNDALCLRTMAQRPPLTHAGAYQVNPATALVAAADVDAERLARFGRDWEVPALYADYREMLQKERLDILSVCTPPALHARFVMEACRAGLAGIFCEKPLAEDPTEAMAVVRACEWSGTILAVNYFRRWNPTIAIWAGRLATGELGNIRRVTASYTKGIVQNGTHVIDLLHWFVGRIENVQALRWAEERGNDLAVDALCISETGVPCYLQACRQEDFNILEIDLLTDRGRLRLAENGRRLEWQEVREDPYYARYRILSAEPTVVQTAWQDCFSCAVQDLVESVERGTAPRCGGQEAYEAIAVAAAIRTSARESGTRIEVGTALAPVPDEKTAGGRP